LEVEGQVARYKVQPGGMGRHGHQGFVDIDYAVFDGRAFLLPDTPSISVELRFLLPQGWSAHTTITDQNNDRDAVGRSCVAAGPFRVDENPDLNIAVFEQWPKDHQDTLIATTRALDRTFRDQLGQSHQRSVVWTPKPTTAGLYGASTTDCIAFEQPEANAKAWRLLAHRFAHATNKYPPYGMRIRDPEDQWFMEGWATYMEVMATLSADIARDEAHFDHLYHRYRDTITRKPEFDVPLATEATATSEVREFLHYVKGPLVVRMLAHTLKQRSGRSLQDFMHRASNQYGQFKGTVPLREALADYSGIILDDFWLEHVDRPGEVIPVWR
jgi:hypothetical protein